jgi:protein-disulfide isomerase/uncharacterized membrane protein
MNENIRVTEKQETLVTKLNNASAARGVLPADMSTHRPFFSGRLPFVLLLILALVGVFATGFLTYRHVLLESHTGQIGQSFLCLAHGRINCDAILLTEYGVLFGYISSAALGLAGFVFVLWCAANGVLNDRVRKIAWVMLVAYFFAAIGFSWYYAYIMMFEVDFICTWCIVVHVINLISLITVIVFSIRLRKAILLREIASLGERIYFVVGAIAVPALVLGTAALAEKALKFDDLRVQYEEIANDTAVVMAIIRSSPSYDIRVGPGDPVFGSVNAPFPIIFFSDFQCPACAKTEKILKDIVRRNPQFLKLVYKNYPLSKECNEGIIASSDLHPKACQAARAAYAAYLLGGVKAFWAFGDMLFENQKHLKKNPWTTFAERLSLDTKKFEELMKPDSPAAKKVAEDVNVGLGLQLNGTPKVFFEGKRIPENIFGGYFVDALEELIKSNHPDQQELSLNRQ